MDKVWLVRVDDPSDTTFYAVFSSRQLATDFMDAISEGEAIGADLEEIPLDETLQEAQARSYPELPW